MMNNSIWRILLILLSSAIFRLVHYEATEYKSFGFRYWLSVFSGIWLMDLTLLSYFLVFTGASIMVYNQLERKLVWFFFFFVGVAVGLTFMSWHTIKILIRRTRYYRNMRDGE